MNRFSLGHLLVLVTMCVLLFNAAYPALDVGRYQCYATAFWHGTNVLQTSEYKHCGFLLENQKPVGPYRILPLEYPPLSLIPFSLGLSFDSLGYATSFKIWMLLTAVSLYLLLLRYGTQASAIVFALYLVAGSWALTSARFDIFPALLTFGALLLAEKKKWNWAYIVLGAAVLVKLYPIVLLPFFFVAQQKTIKGKLLSLKRIEPLMLFSILCIVVFGLSYMLNPAGTLEPLTYFQHRPIQIESLWSSILWIIQPLSSPLHYIFSFGSINILSPLSEAIIRLSSILSSAGFLVIIWLQIRGKITLAYACMLMLLLTILLGKVFSIQYLMWIVPFIAYVGKNNPWHFIPWYTICALSTWIYPYIYPSLFSTNEDSLFFNVLSFRNGLMVLFFLFLLTFAIFKKTPHPIHRQLTK